MRRGPIEVVDRASAKPRGQRWTRTFGKQQLLKLIGGSPTIDGDFSGGGHPNFDSVRLHAEFIRQVPVSISQKVKLLVR